jgi:hypothetical protein
MTGKNKVEEFDTTMRKMFEYLKWEYTDTLLLPDARTHHQAWLHRRKMLKRLHDSAIASS